MKGERVPRDEKAVHVFRVFQGGKKKGQMRLRHIPEVGEIVQFQRILPEYNYRVLDIELAQPEEKQIHNIWVEQALFDEL